MLAVLIIVLSLINHYHTIDFGQFAHGFGLSLVRVVVAYMLSAIIALIVALVVTKNNYVESVFLPILDVAQSFPSFALLPLLVSFFGANSIAVIIILVIAMIWPIIFSLIGAIKIERTDLANAATIYHAVGVKRVVYFKLPSILPSFMTGSIVAWGQAWDVLVGAEIIAKVGGVGSLLGAISASAKTGILFFGILLYLMFIFVINQFVWLPLLKIASRYQNDA